MIEDVKDILVTVVASGAFFSFLQFIITRFDNKKGIEKRLTAKIDTVKEDVQTVKNDVKNVEVNLSKEVKGVSERLEEHRAVLARTHILRFADELTVRKHSKEYFEQQLQDIKTYETYCFNHPNFQNEMAQMSVDFIREEYRRLYLNPNDGTD